MTQTIARLCVRCKTEFYPLADWVDKCPDCSLEAETEPQAEPDVPTTRRIGKTTRHSLPWRVCGFLTLGGKLPDEPENLRDFVRMAWTDEQITSDLAAGVIPVGTIITGPMGKSGVVVMTDNGLWVRRISEVLA